MGITIYNSNRMEELADILGEKLRSESAGKGIFFQSQVIVPNKGIARFLTLRFTEKNKIVMGMEFPYLMTFLLRNIGQLSGDIQEQGEEAHDASCWDALINKETLTFRIFSLLPDLCEKEEFSVLQKYCGEDNGRCWQLAETLAALYDRYILYRPDWINRWEKSEECSESEKWQCLLWRKVRENWPANADGKAVHFAHIHQNICKGKWGIQSQDTIRLFGFSSVAEPVLECLEKLGVAVEIYALSPCCDYWGDVKKEKDELKTLIEFWNSVRNEGLPDDKAKEFFDSQKELFFQNNPLLGAFGTQGRNFFVRSLEWENESHFPMNTEADILLHKLQNELCLNNKLPAAPPVYSGEPDSSIQIHNCYSEFREVEALHDYLLGCFAADKTLTFNDVLIMSPVPERYRSFVDAIFHNPSYEGTPLKIALADRSASVQSQAARVFPDILKLYKQEFEAKAVLDVWENQEIYTNFGATEDDLQIIRKAVLDAGICWGWNGSERKTEVESNSWVRGLDRLFFGYAAMKKDTIEIKKDDNLYGVANFEDHGVLLGNFCRFVHKLHDAVLFMQKSVPFREWQRFLLDCSASFFGEKSEFYGKLNVALNNMKRYADNSGCGELEFSADVILKIVQQLLDKENDSSGDFLRGRITFCGMRPMRSIPAKVICLLGMNYDTFPREGGLLSFDLMRRHPRCNDPHKADDERQLFLEILLSARKSLYISYIGHGIRDNKIYPASGCVEELRLYLKDAFGAGSWYDAEEPLQAFDPKLFQNGNPVQAHSDVLLKCCELSNSSAKCFVNRRAGAMYPIIKLEEAIPEEFLRISLADLEKFFRNPAEYFWQKRMNAFAYERKELEVPEGEVLFLQKFSKEDIFAGLETGNENFKNELIDKLKQDAVLPQNYDGSEWKAWDEAEKLHNKKQEIEDETDEENVTERDPWEYECDGVNIQIPAMTFYDNVLIAECLWDFDKNIHSFILNHVAANLNSEESIETTVLGSTATYHNISKMTKEEAEKKMKDFIGLYKDGLRTPLPFSPKISYDIFNKKKYTPQNDVSKFFGSEYPEDEFKKYAGTFFSGVTIEGKKAKKGKK